MKAELNHIGIAVDDLPKVKRLFEILGIHKTHEEAVVEQGVKVHFMPLPLKPSQIELLEVEDPNGTVAQFIEKRGPGIHHLSFLVPAGSLEPLSEHIVQEGYRLIYPRPKKGAHNMRINFIHPQSTGGILIEIMEPEK